MCPVYYSEKQRKYLFSLKERGIIKGEIKSAIVKKHRRKNTIVRKHRRRK